MIHTVIPRVVLMALVLLVFALGTPTWATGGRHGHGGHRLHHHGGGRGHFSSGHHFPHFPHHHFFHAIPPHHHGGVFFHVTQVWVPGRWVRSGEGVWFWRPGHWIVIAP
jgi:hypothetical protein